LNIPPDPQADKERICLRTTRAKKEETPPQERVLLRSLRKPKSPQGDEGKIYELPGKNGQLEYKSLRELQSIKKQRHRAELDEFATKTKGQFLVTQQ